MQVDFVREGGRWLGRGQMCSGLLMLMFGGETASAKVGEEVFMLVNIRIV